MTEAEWLAAADPRLVAPRLARLISPRKMRLFGCACCRRGWQAAGQEPPAALDAAEAYADGEGTAAQLAEINSAVLGQRNRAGRGAASFALDSLAQVTRPETAAHDAGQAAAYAWAARFRSRSPDWFDCFWAELAGHMRG